MLAAGGDAGDDLEEMRERRDELLRIKEDLDVGLNTDEDEELAGITERTPPPAAPPWLGVLARSSPRAPLLPI